MRSNFLPSENINLKVLADRHLTGGNALETSKGPVAELSDSKSWDLKKTNGRSGNAENGSKYGEMGIRRQTVAGTTRKNYQNKNRRSVLDEVWSQNKRGLYNSGSALSAFRIWDNTWEPQPDRFLMAYCQLGRVSNRVLCFLNAIKVASVLNRTLLITMDPRYLLHHYDRHLMMDIDHVRLCYGNNTIMTVQEYRDVYKTNVVIDQVLCAGRPSCPDRMNFSQPESSFGYWDGIRFSESAKNPQLPEREQGVFTKEEILSHFGNASGRVVFMGEFFYISLKTKDGYDVPIKRSDKCHSNVAVVPDHSILESGKEFVKDVFQGEEFLGIHLRREDFKRACGNDPDCFPPIEVITNCLKNKLKFFGAKNIFLATNADAQELAYVVENLASMEEGDIRIVRLKTENKTDKFWAKPLINATSTYNLVEAELDKVICMQAFVFIGSMRSTYTADIQRLRYGFGTADPRDSYLCEDPRH